MRIQLYTGLVILLTVSVLSTSVGSADASCRRFRRVHYGPQPQDQAASAPLGVPWLYLAGLGLDVLKNRIGGDNRNAEPAAPRTMTTTRTVREDDGIKTLRSKIEKINSDLGITPAAQPTPVTGPEGDVPPPPSDDPLSSFPA